MKKATFESDPASVVQIMFTAEMFKYYGVFPKIVFPDFAIFYCCDHLAPEIKLELEVILGMTIKFLHLDEEKVMDLIRKSETQEIIKN